MMDWAQCSQYQWASDNNKAFITPTQLNDLCPCICPHSTASCDGSMYDASSQGSILRLKSKRTVQPSYKFADHPFVPQQKNSKTKQKNGKSLQASRLRQPKNGGTAHVPVPQGEEEKVETFLLTNPEFLTTFVNKFVDLTTLNEWSRQNEELMAKKEHEVDPLEHGGAGEEEGGAGEEEGGAGEDHNENEEEETLDDLGPLMGDLDATMNDHEEEEAEALEGSAGEEVPEDVHGEGISELTHVDPHVPEEAHSETEAKGDGIEILEDLKGGEEEEEGAGSDEPVFPQNVVMVSTSTSDAELWAVDLCAPPLLVTTSTSTTDGLILAKPLGPQIPNPKVVSNLSKLTKIREARANRKACLEAKARQAERDLAIAKQRARYAARKLKEAMDKANKQNGKSGGQNGSFDAKCAAARMVDEAFMTLVVKFHNKPPKCPLSPIENYDQADYGFSQAEFDALEAYFLDCDGYEWSQIR